jgi:hypothetical protein
MRKQAWRLSAASTVLLLVLLVALPFASNAGSSGCDREALCDPHGYVVIFSVVFAAPVVVALIIALTGTIGRRRSGPILTAVCALPAAFVVAASWSWLPLWTQILTVVSVLAAIAFPINAVVRSRRTPVR